MEIDGGIVFRLYTREEDEAIGRQAALRVI